MSSSRFGACQTRPRPLQVLEVTIGNSEKIRLIVIKKYIYVT